VVVEELVEGEVEVELEVELELVLELLLEPVELPEPVVDELVVDVAGVVEEVELVLDGLHVADWNVVPAGMGICEGGVPGGTFVVNV
jgi:hypothetical protein